MRYVQTTLDKLLLLPVKNAFNQQILMIQMHIASFYFLKYDRTLWAYMRLIIEIKRNQNPNICTKIMYIYFQGTNLFLPMTASKHLWGYNCIALQWKYLAEKQQHAKVIIWSWIDETLKGVGFPKCLWPSSTLW